jgi:hypothetical protein
MKVSNLIAVVALIVAGVLGCLLFQTGKSLAARMGEMETLRIQKIQLEQRVADLEAATVDEATLNRLRASEREAIKLRGDVGNLKKALAAAESAAAAAAARNVAAAKREIIAPAPAPQAAQQTNSNPGVRVFNYKGVANLLPGQAMAMGGWETKPGKKALAVMTPVVDPNNPQSITVNANWIELSTDAATNLNLDSLLAGVGQQTTMDQARVDAFIKQLQQTPGVSILSTPKVTTISGREAQVSVTEQRSTPGGMVDFGPQIGFVPTQRQDGSIDLAVDATVKVPASNGPEGR